MLSDKIHQAKKHYSCDACELWLNSGLKEIDVSPNDWLIVEGAMADKWKILPGREYRKATFVHGNYFVTYRGRLDMDSLCSRLDLFPDE